MFTLEDTLLSLAVSGEVDGLLYISVLKCESDVIARSFSFGSFGNVDQIMSAVGLPEAPILSIYAPGDVVKESQRGIYNSGKNNLGIGYLLLVLRGLVFKVTFENFRQECE